jgi:hypothetical protein
MNEASAQEDRAERADRMNRSGEPEDQATVRTQRGDVSGDTPAAHAVKNSASDTSDRPQSSRADEVGLLGDGDLEDLQTRWERVQIAFVDQPRDAVQQAHDLVDDVVVRLTRTFTKQRDDLETTWTRGGDVSTEDLRLALQRYRAFFNRLLST